MLLKRNNTTKRKDQKKKKKGSNVRRQKHQQKTTSVLTIPKQSYEKEQTYWGARAEHVVAFVRTHRIHQPDLLSAS